MEDHGIIHKKSQGVVDAAFEFAKKFHGDQKRKYTGEDYINHPVEVARIVSSVTDDVEMIAAALLHDTLEDTEAKYEDFVVWGLHFNIYDMVVSLTDVSKSSDGNRKIRKYLDLEHLATGSHKIATIKLADLINNSSSIVKHDPKFAKVFMNEKRELLKVLQHGDQRLLNEAQSIVDCYFKINTEAET